LQFQRSKINQAVLTAIAAMSANTAVSQESRAIEEIVVTATKRAVPLQDVPIAIQALTEDSMDDLGIDNFEDYLIQMPGITAGGSGPGQNTIYIRGVASTTPNLTTAGVAGLAPNVALYLDEQPLSQPGRNLDVYAADLNRIEVLSGPQGTLFGASSQAGNVRLITNKPDPTERYGDVHLSSAYVTDGEPNYAGEVMLNLPVSDRFTLRGVAYLDRKGGYIDNVRGTRDLSESARFREQGEVRANGEPVSLRRSGLQSASGVANALAAGDTSVGERIADFSNVNFIAADNQGLVEDDFNEATYQGARLSGLFDINEDWELLVAHTRQKLDADGVFFSDPGLGDYEVQRFEEDELEDEFSNTNWTLTGRINELEVVYAGAYTDRETEQRVDYTDYLFVGQYLPYYICDSTVTYPEYNNYYTALGFVDGLPAGNCYAPNQFVRSRTDTTVESHEIRFLTDPAKRIRLTGGVFTRELELEERNDFVYPGSEQALLYGTAGFSDNFPFPNAYNSDPGPFPDGTVFRNDVRRTDEQTGVFAEVNFDVGDQVEVTLGARWYDIEVDFEGGANASFCNGFQPDVDRFGTNITDLYDGNGEFTFIGDCTAGGGLTFTRGQMFDEIKSILEAADSYSVGRGAFVNAPNAISDAEIEGIVNALNAPDEASVDGTIIKASVAWRPTETQMYYATISEGFRPGLLNRPGGAVGPNGFTVPFELDTDDVTNYEFGWKLDLFDYTMRFNGTVFYAEIESLQTTIFDPSISNLFFSDNAADAEIMGIEGDVVWQPEDVPGLSITGAFSLLDTEITKVLTPTNDVRKGDELAFAPEFQTSLRVRYEWPLDNGLRAHVMPHVVYSAEAYSDVVTINRDKLDSWVLVGLTAGVSSDIWRAEFYADNIFDEQAELTSNFVYDRRRVNYAPPTTIGLRVTFDF
jgi:outer membrane receptor protein involved in Fe transport